MECSCGAFQAGRTSYGLRNVKRYRPYKDTQGINLCDPCTVPMAKPASIILVFAPKDAACNIH